MRISKAEIARRRIAAGVKISSREGQYLIPEHQYNPEEVEDKVIKQHLDILTKKENKKP